MILKDVPLGLIVHDVLPLSPNKPLVFIKSRLDLDSSPLLQPICLKDFSLCFNFEIHEISSQRRNQGGKEDSSGRGLRSNVKLSDEALLLMLHGLLTLQ